MYTKRVFGPRTDTFYINKEQKSCYIGQNFGILSKN